MIFVIKVLSLCVNIASSPWIGHRGSPASTLDNTTTTTTTTTTTYSVRVQGSGSDS